MACYSFIEVLRAVGDECVVVSTAPENIIVPVS
jgi:phosphoserine phosphatase